MSWVISYFLLTLTPSISEEVKRFSEQAGKQVDEEALTFLKDLYTQAPPDSPIKCKKCVAPPIGAHSSSYNLMTFMSFSVPLESWKEWSKSLEKIGGVFVLRGLPGNSFQIFAQKIKELRNAGINAPIYVDPEAYHKYGIQAVPTTVLLDGEKYDKITGNIHLEAALRAFKEKGSSNIIARELLSKYELPTN